MMEGMSGSQPFLRKWLRRGLLVLCSLLLLLIILELAVRAYARLASQERTVTADSVLGWRLIPHAKHLYRKEEQPYLIVINSKGLRDREHSYEKSPGVFRIVVIGDSFVFGSGGVQASDRFTDILERSTRNIEVINMGVPAYGTDQEYLYLKTEGLKYHPDLVIVCAFGNDFVESFSTVNPSIGRPKGYFSMSTGQLVFHPPSFSLFYRLSQESYVLGLVDLVVGNVLRAYWSRHSFMVLSRPERAQAFKQLFISARDLCREQGSEFILVYFPARGQKSKDLIELFMGDLAATDGTRTLDLLDYMQRANAERPAYFQHDIHFNEYGHQVVAKAMLEYLVTNGLLSSASAGASRPTGLRGKTNSALKLKRL
jgi:hypothetical protein